MVLSSMMLFKRSFGLTRSLFIVYVHKQNHLLGFGMLTAETAVFSSRDWRGQYNVVEYCLESVEGYSEAELWNRNVNTV